MKTEVSVVSSATTKPESGGKRAEQKLPNGDFNYEVVVNVEDGILESTDEGLYKYIGTIL